LFEKVLGLYLVSLTQRYEAFRIEVSCLVSWLRASWSGV